MGEERLEWSVRSVVEWMVDLNSMIYVVIQKEVICINDRTKYCTFGKRKTNLTNRLVG